MTDERYFVAKARETGNDSSIHFPLETSFHFLQERLKESIKNQNEDEIIEVLYRINRLSLNWIEAYGKYPKGE